MLQLLLAARKRLGLTQEEMASKLGISRNYLALIETGKRRVPPHVADQLVTMQQGVVTDAANQTIIDPTQEPVAACQNCATLRKRISDLEAQLATAYETINNQSKALAQGRAVAAPASGACGGGLNAAPAKRERRAGA